jgi:uncharacterized protein YjbJ (UPF0337 family)
MSKPSNTIVGNLKRLVGEVLGDGELVVEGERQSRESALKRSNEERPTQPLSDIETPT